MVNLTEASKFGKRASRWFLVSALIVLATLILIFLGRSVKNALFPPKPPPSTVAFGKLPPLDVSEGVKAKKSINYALETISGDLSALASEAKVFKIALGVSTFGALERTKMTVSSIGFGEPRRVEGLIAEFVDPDDENRIITIDAISGNFELKSNYVNDLAVVSSRPGSVDEAVSVATRFFNHFGLENEQFPPEKIETTFYKPEGAGLVEVPILSLANLVLVNFTRADIDKIKVISPQDKVSPARALVAKDKVVAAELSKATFALNKFATYPLKGTLRAFEDLKNGKGAFNKQPENNYFAIRDVAIAYLETKKYQEFLQPVYVFKSDRGLIAFVAAVDEVWTLDNSTPPLPPLPRD